MTGGFVTSVFSLGRAAQQIVQPCLLAVVASGPDALGWIVLGVVPLLVAFLVKPVVLYQVDKRCDHEPFGTGRLHNWMAGVWPVAS